MRRPPAEALAKSRIVKGVFDVGMFEAKLAKGRQALERAKIRGGAYYEKKLRKFDELVANAKRAQARSITST